MYDPSANQWTCSTDDNAPTGCASKNLEPIPSIARPQALAGPDGNVYLLGFESTIVEVYDPLANTWTCSTDDTSTGCDTKTIAPLPLSLEYLGVAAGLSNDIYAIGGYTSDGGTYYTVASVERYALPFQVPITPGWNFIDLPLQNMNIYYISQLVQSVDSAVGNGAVGVAATYSSGRFSLYVPGFSQDQRLLANQGVAVFSASNGSWMPTGQYFTSGQTITLHPGWNLVAAPFPLIGLNSDVIASQASGCGIQSVAVYRNGTYLVYVPGSSTPFFVAATNSMWIECMSTAAWTPT